jgi:hypothetical protein
LNTNAFLIVLYFKAQVVRIDRDGTDAKSLESFKVSSYIECIQYCLSNSECHYIVKSGDTCFLKASTPLSGPCAKTDECAVVLGNNTKKILFKFLLNCIIKDIPMTQHYTTYH